jgi:hypothetical protein
MFFIDIVLCFFKQEMDEEGNSKQETLTTIATLYFKNGFLKDFITFLPLGYVFSIFDSRLSFFWLIKILRISSLNH